MIAKSRHLKAVHFEDRRPGPVRPTAGKFLGFVRTDKDFSGIPKREMPDDARAIQSLPSRSAKHNASSTSLTQ